MSAQNNNKPRTTGNPNEQQSSSRPQNITPSRAPVVSKSRAPVYRPTPRQQLATFWTQQQHKIDHMSNADIRHAHRNSILPLARIKRIMKIEDDVREMMISAEVPALLAKACELFVEELTLCAWVNTDDSKRKTLQRSDLAATIGKYDHLDFLIDILPREEANSPAKRSRQNASNFENIGQTTFDIQNDGQTGSDGTFGLQFLSGGQHQSTFTTPTGAIIQHIGEPITISGGGQTRHGNAGPVPMQVQLITNEPGGGGSSQQVLHLTQEQLQQVMSQLGQVQSNVK